MVRPSPEPRSIRMSVRVDAAKAPATMGPQLTADEDDSMDGSAATSVSARIAIIHAPLSHKQQKQDDDRDWDPE
jgi:hypothetical protein